MSVLDIQLDRIAQAPRLLVACDYDGVIAPIVSDPAKAVPLPETVKCLAKLAALRQTDVAVVSGRSIESLQSLLGTPDRWHIVGCHGAEWPQMRWTIADQESLDAFRPLVDRLHELSLGVQGCHVEEKPGGAAFHYRNAAPEAFDELLPHILALGHDRPDLLVRHGKKVVEFSVTSANKGDAFQRLRYVTGATASIFVGDDVTDEDAFRTLGPSDIGVSVGGARDGAAFDIADPEAVRSMLCSLQERRARWCEETRPKRIERHSILSDQRCVALVDDSATIDWLCFPRVDSPAFFAGILGPRIDGAKNVRTDAGHFSIAPADATGPGRQTYVDNGMVVRTAWPKVSVIDYLDCSGGRPFQRAGSSDLIRVVEGRGRMQAKFAPRIDFGRTVTAIAPHPSGLVIEGQPDPCILYAPGVQWTIMKDGLHDSAIAEFDVEPDKPVVFELRYGTANFRESITPEHKRRAQTERFWGTWAASLRLPSIAPELVLRSALTLKALVHGPTGAIAAAATTSLPEWPGGMRNWDYRYCWPRDAALSGLALLKLGNTGNGMRLLDWFLGIIEHTQSPERFRPIYTVSGRELGPEAELSDLLGYADSRPVRVSNAAAQQIQLDVFGPIVDLAYQLAESGTAVSPDHWRLAEAMVTAVERRWHDPDNGIWEVRGPRRHYVHSKIMCWMAVDRAIKLSDLFFGHHKPDWDRLRDAIARDVLDQGWDEHLGAFRIAYDTPELDAAALQIGLSGLLPATDVRFMRTVENVDRFLRMDSAVYRYRFDDGIPGQEGGFLICMGWLIESLALIGETKRAHELFEKLIACAGPTGLMAEQVDPYTGHGLGNYPQAYSHLALINAAVALGREP